jgi:hypothetical protein
LFHPIKIYSGMTLSTRNFFKTKRIQTFTTRIQRLRAHLCSCAAYSALCITARAKTTSPVLRVFADI